MLKSSCFFSSSLGFVPTGALLPLIRVQHLLFTAGTENLVAAPLGLLQRWTGLAAPTRLNRHLAQPLRLAYAATAAARAPRAPIAHLAVPRHL